MLEAKQRVGVSDAENPHGFEKEDVNSIEKVGRWIYGYLDTNVSNF